MNNKNSPWWQSLCLPAPRPGSWGWYCTSFPCCHLENWRRRTTGTLCPLGGCLWIYNFLETKSSTRGREVAQLVKCLQTWGLEFWHPRPTCTRNSSSCLKTHWQQRTVVFGARCSASRGQSVSSMLPERPCVKTCWRVIREGNQCLSLLPQAFTQLVHVRAHILFDHRKVCYCQGLLEESTCKPYNRYFVPIETKKPR